MADQFMAPHRIISGEGALAEAADEVKRLGKKALIVTDRMMRKLQNLDKVTDMLKKHGIAWAVYDAIDREPDDTMVFQGLAAYRDKGCDFLLALGGGSPIDAMKAIAMLAACGGGPADYMGVTVTEKLCPMAAIPTTAGTGSEATQFTIITDSETRVKMLLKGPSLMPDIAVIDPAFTVTAPRHVTAATGVDALTHAIEAYTSRKAQSLSDTFALSACRRIFLNLKRVWDDGSDMEGRMEMSLAALEAGIAFNNSSVTVVHGMSRPIGAMFHVPHGLSNAMLLPVCLEYVTDGAVDRFADISRACGLDVSGSGDEAAAAALTDAVKRLLKSIGIPTPAEYGIDRDDFFKAVKKMAEDAESSGSPANTRKTVTAETMEMLYKKLWQERKEVPDEIFNI